MSCSLTIDAVKARTKTVTRRHIDTWRDLKPGDHLTLIEKGMGLAKGAHQVVLAEVEIINVSEEWLFEMRSTECAAEGFPEMDALEFIVMWCLTHKPTYPVRCRRIEWRYVA